MTLRPVPSSDPDVTAVWKATEEETRAIRALSLGCRGSIVTVTFSGAGTSNINHKLGKQPVGWLVLDKNATTDVWRTAWTSTTITLQTAAAVTLKVLVF